MTLTDKYAEASVDGPVTEVVPEVSDSKEIQTDAERDHVFEREKWTASLVNADKDRAFEREQWKAAQANVERDYALRLREVEIKEAEARRSRWMNPLVLAVVGATLAAIGNGYIAWLNGVNQSAIESTRNATQIALEEQKAEGARILEAIKDVSPDKAIEKLRFLIQVGLVADPNRKAALEAYIKTKTLTAPPQTQVITERFSTGWLGGGNSQADQCRIGRASVAQKHPGKSILLVSSSEQSKRDAFGRVEYRYFCTFQVQ